MKDEATSMQMEDFLKTVGEDAFKIQGAVAYDAQNNVILFSPNTEVYPYIKVPVALVASVTPLRSGTLLTQSGWKKVTVASLQFAEAGSEEAKFLQELYMATMKHIGEYFAKNQASPSGQSCSCDGGGEVRAMDSCGCPHACLGTCAWGQCYGGCI
jgi:hypothetical protein